MVQDPRPTKSNKWALALTRTTCGAGKTGYARHSFVWCARTGHYGLALAPRFQSPIRESRFCFCAPPDRSDCWIGRTQCVSAASPSQWSFRLLAGRGSETCVALTISTGSFGLISWALYPCTTVVRNMTFAFPVPDWPTSSRRQGGASYVDCAVRLDAARSGTRASSPGAAGFMPSTAFRSYSTKIRDGEGLTLSLNHGRLS